MCMHAYIRVYIYTCMYTNLYLCTVCYIMYIIYITMYVCMCIGTLKHGASGLPDNTHMYVCSCLRLPDMAYTIKRAKSLC